MNKMLIAIFDTPDAADAGLHALRRLHSEGDITLYDTGVIAKDLAGVVSVQSVMERDPVGASVGMAVGSLIGLLGGPVGMLIGASTGAVAGTLRDFWVAGVGMDFIEEAERLMATGKVAVVAEIDEEWVTPVDVAMASLGGTVLRRARNEALEVQFDHDIVALKAEVKELEAEAAHASESAKAGLQAKVAAAQAGLDAAVFRAQQRVEVLKLEAEAKADALKAQMNDARSGVHDRIDDRLKRVKSGYHARGHKLSQAWSLTKEALSV
jgi:uncharacterized membrane protein